MARQQRTCVIFVQNNHHMSVAGLSMFKTVLLPVDQSDVMRSVMETCWLAADRFQATIEGVALRPAFAEIVAPDPIVAVTISPADWNELEFYRETRALFDAFAVEHPGPIGTNGTIGTKEGAERADFKPAPNGTSGTIGRGTVAGKVARPSDCHSAISARAATSALQRPK
jgi:hypothetical protein